MQEFVNVYTYSLELEIYLYINEEILFDYFEATIEDSINITSKIIRKKEGQIKYNDNLSSGTPTIFVREDPDKKNRYIINMGSISPNERVIFKTKFINFIKFYKNYEFELFRNFPIFKSTNEIYQNKYIKGSIFFKMNHAILNINKNILLKDLNITEELYLDKEYKNYLINYEIEDLPIFESNYPKKTPCLKISYGLDINYPIIYSQESSIVPDETNYCIRHNPEFDISNEETKNYPGFFIFLVDQGHSMSIKSLKLVSRAVKLFLQSLPEGSYYQIIGYDSQVIKLDKEPKEYKLNNINKSLEIIDKLYSYGTTAALYNPLKDIYDTYETYTYSQIHLPKYIFLLAGHDVKDKEKVLDLIKKENNNKFRIFPIGIGDGFDKKFIKKIGKLGKGNYYFCKDLNTLNSAVVNELKNLSIPFVFYLNVISFLNMHQETINISNDIINENEIFYANYFVNKKTAKKLNKIDIKFRYIDNNAQEINKNYVLVPQVMPKGDELSKLLMNKYLKRYYNMDIESQISRALKYQILTECTTLFTEVKVSDEIPKEVKLQIIGDKNIINIIEKKSLDENKLDDKKDDELDDSMSDSDDNKDKEDSKYKENEEKKIEEKKLEKKSQEKSNRPLNSMEKIMRIRLDMKQKFSIKVDKDDEEEKENDKKEKIMDMIRTQDFIKGFWKENVYTRKIKEKYIKIYDSLKDLDDFKINDETAITILVILFIYNEHKELVDELFMIIKKAKIFIKKETNVSYEEIMKNIE